MIDLSKITDPYERKARLYPALICLFPLMMSISISYPQIYSTLSAFVALVIAVGGMQLLAHLARDKGKNIEPKLYEEWGGMPSVAILRYNDQSIPTPAKIKYHNVLASESKIAAPTESYEKTNPEKADDIYTSWSDFLRGKARDEKKYPLVFTELVNYGFRRNLFGIKWFCIFSAFIAIVILILPQINHFVFSEIQIAVGLFLLVYVMIFIFVINGNWVKNVANAYAKSLIEILNIPNK